MSSLWPIHVQAVAPVACEALAWKRGAGFGVTVVVKATFAMVPDGNARLVSPGEIVREDRYRGQGALDLASDLAPYLPKAGVILIGSAHAPPGQQVAGVSARLGIYGDTPLLNKVLHVVGSRYADAHAAPKPFDAMPITYELAFGGAGFDDNPVGTGLHAGSPAPNVVDPARPNRPAGFGPISKYWGPRKRLLGGGADPSWSDIPPALDWSFFHAAPADQQIDHLRGGEWIFLDGLHPSAPSFRTRLPDARAHARWKLRGEAGEHALDLRADTLLIMPDQQTCAVSWRGVAMLEPRDIARIQIVAGLECAGYALHASLSRALEPSAGASGARDAPRPSPPLDSTLTGAAPASRVLPFTPAAPSAPETPPPPERSAPHQPPLTGDDGVHDFDDPGTSILDSADAIGSTAAPFQLAAPGQRRPAAPIPGAPWSGDPSALPFRPPVQTGPVSITATDTPLPPARVEAPPVAPPPRVEIATPVEGADRAMQPKLPANVEPPKPPPVEPPHVVEPPKLVEPPHGVEPSAAAEPPKRGEPAKGPIADLVSEPTEAGSLTPELTGLRATVARRVSAREPLTDLTLAGADLHDLDLGGAVLSRMHLSGVNLSGAKLEDARLAGADLTAADLSGANLRGADLSGTNLTRANLDGARLDGAMLGDATLLEARGARASCEKANVARARFHRASFEEATFAGAEGTQADFTGAKLEKARFSGATLIEARFDDANAAGSDFSGARLSDARAARATFTGAKLEGVDAERSVWERATLDGASFARARLKGSDLSRANATDASFAEADLTGCNLQRFAGDRTNLSGAVIEGADLRSAQLVEASFERANLRDVSGMKSDFARARFVDADLQGATLRAVRLAGASLVRANLEGADLRDADVQGANMFGASRKTTKLALNAKGVVEVDPDGEG